MKHCMERIAKAQNIEAETSEQYSVIMKIAKQKCSNQRVCQAKDISSCTSVTSMHPQLALVKIGKSS